MSHQNIELEDTVYLGFVSNDTSGSAVDGTTPLFDVRLGGAAASATPTLSGTPDLLTHANYGPGAYECAVAATAGNGFAVGNTYLVFVTLTADSQTPGACIGSFRISSSPLPRKNKAFSNIEFLMVDNSDHVTPETGLTVSGTRSIDGAAFGAVTGTIAEVANGIYQLDASAADMNGSIITFRFTATGADDTFLTVRTAA